MLTQEAPNILDINVFQRLRQQRAGPAGITRGWWLIQKRQNALVRRLTVDRRPGRARPVGQSVKPVIGKAVPPFRRNINDQNGGLPASAAIGCREPPPFSSRSDFSALQ